MILEPQILKHHAGIIAVQKPSFWQTVAGNGRWPVLTSWLENKVGRRIFTVHRLDVGTSGVIIFSDNPKTHRELSLKFQDQLIEKEYHFVSQGRPPGPSFQCRDRVGGKASQTVFEVHKKGATRFSGRAFPKSGRRHQIRIHLRDLNCPILGDMEYGAISATRMALHSFRLRIGPEQEFTSPYPEDFRKIWDEV